MTLNTGSLDTRLRPYLLLLLTLILESPIRRDDQLIPYEEVVAALEKDTISTGSSLGVQPNSSFNCEPFSNTAVIMLQVCWMYWIYLRLGRFNSKYMKYKFLRLNLKNMK